MTRPPVEAPEAPAPPAAGAPQRRIERPRRLPGGRAVVGGLLVALAGVGTFVGWQQAAGTPDRSYVVAARAVRPGESLDEADVRLVAIELPDGVAGGAFTEPAAVAGRVALGPIAEGELVQAGALSDVGAGVPTAEVSFALARDRVVDGRLGPGDLVDVFVTGDDGTSVVAERVQVVTVTDGGATLTSGAELTVTLALTDPSARGAVIQAVRSGEVTLVRSTHLGLTPAAEPGGSPASGSSGSAGTGTGTSTTTTTTVAGGATTTTSSASGPAPAGLGAP